MSTVSPARGYTLLALAGLLAVGGAALLLGVRSAEISPGGASATRPGALRARRIQLERRLRPAPARARGARTRARAARRVAQRREPCPRVGPGRAATRRRSPTSRPRKERGAHVIALVWAAAGALLLAAVALLASSRRGEPLLQLGEGGTSTRRAGGRAASECCARRCVCRRPGRLRRTGAGATGRGTDPGAGLRRPHRRSTSRAAPSPPRRG